MGANRRDDRPYLTYYRLMEGGRVLCEANAMGGLLEWLRRHVAGAVEVPPIGSWSLPPLEIRHNRGVPACWWEWDGRRYELHTIPPTERSSMIGRRYC